MTETGIQIHTRCSAMCARHCYPKNSFIDDRDPIIWPVIEAYDEWLDSQVGPEYRLQPLARDITRITKLYEETSEALNALGGVTGENPRKTSDASMADVLDELADVFFTAALAIQHFTKDRLDTARIIRNGMKRLEERLDNITSSTQAASAESLSATDNAQEADG